MRELLRHWLSDVRDPLMRPGPLGLSHWQWIAGPALLLVSWLLGALLARLTKAALVRLARRTEAAWDDALAAQLRGPLTLLWTIAVLALGHPVLELSRGSEKVFDHALLGGVYAALFWMFGRAIGVIGKVAAASPWAQQHPASRSLVPLASRVARVVLFALALIMLLSELGVPVASLIAGVGIGGLAIALAAQKTVENLIGAFSIGADQPFAEGDFVKIEDFVGTVERIGLRSTRFRTPDRTVITIPNGRLAEMRIESFTARDRFRFVTVLSLVYATTPEQMRTVLRDVEALLRGHPSIWPENVVVRFARFGPSSLDIDVIAWFAVPNWDAFQVCRQDVMIEMMQVVERAGSAFAFPTQTLHVAPSADARDFLASK